MTFKVALSGGPLAGHRFEVPQLDEEFAVAGLPDDNRFIKAGEGGKELWREELHLQSEERKFVGSYSKTKRTVSGRTVYQWNEAGV